MGIEIVKKGDVITFLLENSFDISHYEAFKTLCEANDEEQNRFKVDFAITRYLDSSALGMLLLLREQTKGDRDKVELIHVSGDVLKILEVAQFSQLFTISEAK